MKRRQFVQGAGAGVWLATCPAASHAAGTAASPVAAQGGALGYDWASVPFGGGGFVDGFVFHPRERGLLYARTDIGGAYRFDEPSRSWMPLLDHLARADADLMGVLSLALDPHDAHRLYAACGLYLDERARPAALLSSTDRGATWEVSELGIHLGGNAPGRASGERLQVDPRDSGVLWLGTTRDGLLKSADRGRSFQPTAFGPRHVSFVLVDPGGGSLYAGSHDVPGLYVSHDEGASFTRVPATPRQAAQQAALGSDGTLYVTFAQSDSSVPCNPSHARAGSVWKREPDGRWADVTPEVPGEGRAGFGYSGVDVGPGGRVAVSTIERWDRGDELFFSDDRGAHWTALGPHSRHDAPGYPWLAEYMRTERNMGHWTSALRLDPFDAGRALHGTGYGIWMTRRLGAAAEGGTVPWEYTVAGLEETATLEIRSPATGPRLLAAMGDVAGGAWQDPGKPLGDGFFHPPKETNRSIDFAELSPQFVARTGDGPAGGYWSDDGGQHWQAFARSPRDRRWQLEALAVSARGSALVYAPESGPALWSHDRGTTWARCSGWPAGGESFLRPVADRAADGLFYVYDGAGGRLLASPDGGRHFDEHVGGLPRSAAGRAGVSGWLVSAPGAEGDLWLALPDGLWHIAGRGAEPRRMSPVDQAWMLALGKGRPGGARHSIYLWGQARSGGGAPAEGLFRSDDGGASFTLVNDPAHRYGRLLSMAADAREHGVVYLAPHGRGVVVGRPRLPQVSG